MIFDTSLIFSNAQAITTSTASTNAIDLGTTGTPFGAFNPLVRDIGRGVPLDIVVDVVQAFAGLASLQVAVQMSPDAVNWTTVDTGPVVPAAALQLGYQFMAPRRIEFANQRYLQLFYTVVGTATQGAITAAIVANRQNNIAAGAI